MTAVADKILMPGVREIIIRRLPLERRKKLLRDLARDCWDMEPEVVEVLLTAHAHDSLAGPALRAAWLEYRARLRLADLARHVPPDWDWRCNSCGHLLGHDCGCCCCPGAEEEAQRCAEEALDVLAGGR